MQLLHNKYKFFKKKTRKTTFLKTYSTDWISRSEIFGFWGSEQVGRKSASPRGKIMSGIVPTSFLYHLPLTFLMFFLLIFTHTYMHSCIHAYVHTCIRSYKYTYIHTYIHTYIYAYIHAYMHIARIRIQ